MHTRDASLYSASSCTVVVHATESFLVDLYVYDDVVLKEEVKCVW